MGVVSGRGLEAIYLQVKTSKVYIRDCTLIHPLVLLLFAGKTLDVISEGIYVVNYDCVNNSIHMIIQKVHYAQD